MVQEGCRDSARSPMQWSAEENAGFTKGKPWLRVNPNYRTINAEAQVNDPDSVYACYRELISLRKKHPVFADGRYALLLPENEELFAYTRTNAEEELLVVCNFYGHMLQNPLDAEVSDMRLLISDYPDCRETLRPYEARIYYRTRTGRK
jgi:glucan 1,6-alpha-glucosidase